jgi:hypothetical protein
MDFWMWSNYVIFWSIIIGVVTISITGAVLITLHFKKRG